MLIIEIPSPPSHSHSHPFPSSSSSWQSKQQLTNMYQISFNASDNALGLSQQLNGIDMERYLCTNRTEQSYVLGTAQIFSALDKCLEQAANLAKTND